MSGLVGNHRKASAPEITTGHNQSIAENTVGKRTGSKTAALPSGKFTNSTTPHFRVIIGWKKTRRKMWFSVMSMKVLPTSNKQSSLITGRCGSFFFFYRSFSEVCHHWSVNKLQLEIATGLCHSSYRLNSWKKKHQAGSVDNLQTLFCGYTPLVLGKKTTHCSL